LQKNKKEPKETLDQLELPVFLKIALARRIIRRFCQKVNDTPNQERITPRSQASKKSAAVATTTTTNNSTYNSSIFHREETSFIIFSTALLILIPKNITSYRSIIT
jgi:hypothetical protein